MSSSRSRTKSHVWTYFTAIDSDKKVKCLYCTQSLSVVNKSTYSLRRHVAKKHPRLEIQIQGRRTTDASNPERENSTNNDEPELKHPTSPTYEYEVLSEGSEYLPSSDNDQTPAEIIRVSSSEASRFNFKRPAEQHNNIIAEISEAKKHIDEALVSLKSMSAKKDNEELDEYDHFSHMIAAKIRKIQDMDERETVMNSIQNVVYQALMKNI